MVPGDGIDNDNDGEIDEEECGEWSLVFFKSLGLLIYLQQLRNHCLVLFVEYTRAPTTAGHVG
jgi:hypothetical protein